MNVQSEGRQCRCTGGEVILRMRNWRLLRWQMAWNLSYLADLESLSRSNSYRLGSQKLLVAELNPSRVLQSSKLAVDQVVVSNWILAGLCIVLVWSYIAGRILPAELPSRIPIEMAQYWSASLMMWQWSLRWCLSGHRVQEWGAESDALLSSQISWI
jgi:hypothetical protein